MVILSTLGVYGDSGGRWIDETAETMPARARRGSARIDAERAWQALGARRKLPVAILRLGGIYGPGQNGMVRLLRGTVHRVAKPGHVSNRIHVYDIAQAIEAAFARRAEGLFNIVDDEPASPSEQIAFAAQLLGIDPPPEISYAEAKTLLSPLALSFYEGCIRARNDKLKIRARRDVALSQLSRRPARTPRRRRSSRCARAGDTCRMRSIHARGRVDNCAIGST